MEEQWINDLRKKMASHQTPVPPGLWEQIESALPTPQPAPLPLARKILLWTSGISSIAAAVVLAFLFIPRENPTSVPPSPALQTSVVDVRPVAPVLQSVPRPLRQQPLAQATLSTKDALEQRESAVDHLTTSTQKKTVRSTLPVPGDPVLLPQQKQSAQPESKEKIPQPPTDRSVTKQNVTDRTPDFSRERVSAASQSHLTATAGRPPRRNWAFNLYAANLTHTSLRSSGYGEFVAGTALPKDFSESSFPAKDLIYSNLGKTVETQKKHRFPLQFGLSARYHLTSRLSLESGLTYTYLSSELTSGTADHHFVTEQRLQYLGIPLLLGYDLWKNKTWNLYLSGGGMLEKCIHGKSRTDYVLSNELVASHKNHVMEKPLQCSLLGAMGAQLHLSSHIGIYAEPGVSYYFDNGSPIETIYKDKAFNFNFKLGLRIHFN